jgi:hypothetical protein
MPGLKLEDTFNPSALADVKQEYEWLKDLKQLQEKGKE